MGMSFGGAGLGQKHTFNKPVGGPKATPRRTLCESQGHKLPGHWQAQCPHLNMSHKAFCKSKKMCLGCLRIKPAPPIQYKCPDWMRKKANSQFSNQCQVHTNLCAAPASRAASLIPLSFCGATFWNPLGAGQSGQDPARSDRKIYVAILAY